MKNSKYNIGVALLSAAISGGVLAAEQVIGDGLVVRDTQCLGGDCQNGDTTTAGFDTLILREQNLRIFFDDMSSSGGSFPNNDWRILINGTNSGGADYFGIEDSTAGVTPFRIDAGASDSSLRVSSDGKLGVRTSQPTEDIHVTGPDSPTVRLYQSSSTYGNYTWDVGGNEVTFFIRDGVKNRIPLRIEANAPANSIAVEDTGYVGLGTSAPGAPLHVKTNNSSYATTLLLENTSANNEFTGFSLRNKTSEIDFNNAGGIFKINVDNAPGGELELDDEGNLTVKGDIFFKKANGTVVSLRALISSLESALGQTLP